MNQTLDLPILEMLDSFPDRLFLLHRAESGKYGCYCHQNVHGVACFSTEIGALRFSELIDLTGMAAIEVDFDEARDIAKGRPMPIVSIMLLDKLDDPKIHYVR